MLEGFLLWIHSPQLKQLRSDAEISLVTFDAASRSSPWKSVFISLSAQTYSHRSLSNVVMLPARRTLQSCCHLHDNTDIIRLFFSFLVDFGLEIWRAAHVLAFSGWVECNISARHANAGMEFHRICHGKIVRNKRNDLEADKAKEKNDTANKNRNIIFRFPIHPNDKVVYGIFKGWPQPSSLLFSLRPPGSTVANPSRLTGEGGVTSVLRHPGVVSHPWWVSGRQEGSQTCNLTAARQQ